MKIILPLLVAATLALGCATNRAKSAAPPAPTTGATRSFIEPHYASRHPLYLHVVFGDRSDNGMLVVLDESKGDNCGYDVAYVDENRDGDLTNDSPKAFKSERRGGESVLEPRFAFKAPNPCQPTGTVDCSLDLDTLAGATSRKPQPEPHYFTWTMATPEQWRFMFINGRFHTYPSAADALAGVPVRIGGPCHWSLAAKSQDPDTLLSAALKDPNGCTLRIVYGPAGPITPTLTVVGKTGQPLLKDKKQEFS